VRPANVLARWRIGAAIVVESIHSKNRIRILELRKYSTRILNTLRPVLCIVELNMGLVRSWVGSDWVQLSQDIAQFTDLFTIKIIHVVLSASWRLDISRCLLIINADKCDLKYRCLQTTD